MVQFARDKVLDITVTVYLSSVKFQKHMPHPKIKVMIQKTTSVKQKMWHVYVEEE
jgi:hypothetical protein